MECRENLLIKQIHSCIVIVTDIYSFSQKKPNCMFEETEGETLSLPAKHLFCLPLHFLNPKRMPGKLACSLLNLLFHAAHPCNCLSLVFVVVPRSAINYKCLILISIQATTKSATASVCKF